MKKRWIVIAAIGVLALAIGAVGKRGAAPVTVKTVRLHAQTVEETVSCNGVIEAGDTELVCSSVDCVVDEVLVKVGQSVKAGDPLFSIDKEATKQAQLIDDRLNGALELATMEDVVRAPVDGIVLSVETLDGALLEADVPCVSIASRDSLRVRVLLREKLLPQLSVGQSVRISGAGFDKDLYHGVLSEISFAAVNNSDGESVVEGVVSLRGGEVDASMRLGLSAKAKIVTSTKESRVVIPYEAVGQTTSGQNYVYFAENDKAVYCPITPLEEVGDGVLVSEDSFVGRTLVLEPGRVTGDGESIRCQMQEAAE